MREARTHLNEATQDEAPSEQDNMILVCPTFLARRDGVRYRAIHKIDKSASHERPPLLRLHFEVATPL